MTAHTFKVPAQTADTFSAASSVIKLKQDDGTVDGYYVADVLSRRRSFDDNKTATVLALAMVWLNNAMSYLEMDPKHPYNRNFLNGFITAMQDIDGVAANAGIKRVILPHSFERFEGKEGKPLRDMLAEYGITPEITLPSGVVVSFRKKPYDTDLTHLGMIDPEMALLVRDRKDPSKYMDPVKVSGLLTSNGRGMAFATDRVKSLWDANMMGRKPHGEQLAFSLGNPNKEDRPGEGLWLDIRDRQAAERTKLSFLTGRTPS